MKKFILGLLLLFSINVMAIHVHHFHHYPRTHHSSHVTTHHHNHTTTRIKSVQSQKVRPVTRHHNTKMINTYWRNGVLYYVILRPKKDHVYGNGFVLCEGCNKVLVKKGVKYCSKCRRIKRTKL
jgi:hypothetical protein